MFVCSVSLYLVISALGYLYVLEVAPTSINTTHCCSPTYAVLVLVNDRVINYKHIDVSQMHGATYTVDAEFKTDALVEKSNWVVDIGAASEMLSDVLSKYNFKNLNELFPGENTTTEFMCKASRPPLWAAQRYVAAAI